MRTLSSTLTTAQKSATIDALAKVVLTLTGQTTQTYTRTRIFSLSYVEAPNRQNGEVVLDNSDQVFTTLDLKGYKGVISYGVNSIAGGEEYSDNPPLYVIGQQLHSWPGGLLCSLSLAGIPNLLDEDRANASYTPTQEDLKTVKDLLTELIKAVLPSWAASTAYALDDLVIPATSNGYTYKCTTAGTTAGSAPTWPTTIGGTVTDGTVVWTNQGVELTVYSHATAYTPSFDSEDSLLDVFMPKDAFRIYLDGSRLEAIKGLLEYTRCVMLVKADGQIHIFVPTISGQTWVANTAYVLRDYVQPTTPNNNFTYRCTTAGTSHATTEPTWPTTIGGTVTDGTVVWTAVGFDYEHKLAVANEHTFFNKALRQRLVIPNYIVVKSHPDHADQYSGYAEDTASSGLIPKRQYNYFRLASNAQATAIAEAILARLRLEAETGAASVPMNVGAEVYDYVKVTDSRENDNRIGNVGYLSRHYRAGTWETKFRFGKVDAGGLLGTSIPDTETLEATTQPDLRPMFQEIVQALQDISGTLNTLWAWAVDNVNRLYNRVYALETQRRTPISSTVDFQRFTSSGTWYKPTGVTEVFVLCVGGGGGGAGGGTGSAGDTRVGGTGGGGGATSPLHFDAVDLAETITVTVGDGGAGGASQAAGSAGGTSSFGSVLSAYGGGGGKEGNSGGGTRSGGAGGGAGAVGENGDLDNTTGGGPGGTGGAAENAGFGGAGSGAGIAGAASAWGGAGGGGTAPGGFKGGSSLWGGAGGGAGGAISSSNTEYPGADGGNTGTITVGGGGTGGAARVSGSNGAAGNLYKRGQGGGGGGGGLDPGAGGAGGAPGGGGGGGGANNTGAGAGGGGGRGEVMVWSW